MAIRVLGYKTVVEAKGTWPTNYIAKAEELDLLEDITYGTYAAGAARGNVALLIWNMLRTNMWDVDSESEGDGLTYRDTNKSMLNTKFKDFKYSYAEFAGWKNEDGEVEVTLRKADDHAYEIKENNSYKYEFTYAETDFYTFVDGTEVEVLVNTKDNTLLSMVRTDKDKYVEGAKLDIEEDYDVAAKNDRLKDIYVYLFARVEDKKIENGKVNVLSVDSRYVYELDDSSSKRLKINPDDTDSSYKKTIEYDTAEDYIVIKDGKFATVKDLEVGDVWSEITVSYPGLTDATNDVFYMISGAEAEGKITKLVSDTFKNVADGTADADKTYYVATIDGEEYPVVTKAMYFKGEEDLADCDRESETLVTSSKKAKMKNEEITFVTDFLGRVVAVVFDGDINEGDKNSKINSVGFYAFMGPVVRDGSTYTLTVATEDGEEKLTFAKNIGNTAWKNDVDYAGMFGLIKLNSDGEIIAIEKDLADPEVTLELLKNTGDADALDTAINALTKTITYDLEDETKADDDKKYSVKGSSKVTLEDGKLLDMNNVVDNKAAVLAKVNEDTVVVTLVYDDNDSKTESSDDIYSVEFAGIEAIENMKEDRAVVIKDTADKFARAKYVVIYDEVRTREDDLLGLVKKVVTDEFNATLITIVEDRDAIEADDEGVEYKLVAKPNGYTNDALEGLFVVYSVEETEDGEELTVTTVVSANQLNKNNNDEFKGHAYIPESQTEIKNTDGREAYLQLPADVKTALADYLVDDVIDLDDEDTAKLFDDARFVVLNVTLAEDAPDGATQYYADNYTEVEYDDVELLEKDYISFLGEINDIEGVLIIRGIK